MKRKVSTREIILRAGLGAVSTAAIGTAGAVVGVAVADSSSEKRS